MASPSTRNPGARDPGTPGVRSAERLRDHQTRSNRAPGDQVEDSGRVAQAVSSAGRSGQKASLRAAALAIVFVLLTVMYANSVRVYFNQQRQIADAKALVVQQQKTVDDLYAQLQRWQDPAYVQAQARERLGWVMPGDIGFHVIDADGNVMGGGATIGSAESQQPDAPSETWYDKLAGSILTADAPAPVTTPTPQPSATVTPPR